MPKTDAEIETEIRRTDARYQIKRHLTHGAEAGDLAGALAEVLFQLTCGDGVLYEAEEAETILCGIEAALRGMREKFSREKVNEVEQHLEFLACPTASKAPEKERVA